MGITKEILVQYCDIKQEVRDLRNRIEENQKTIQKIESSGYMVSDVVKGTRKDGRYGHITITGIPLPEYDKVKSLLNRRTSKLILLEEDLLEALNLVEEYIESIEKSEMRILFRLYYLDDLTWYKVALKMNDMFPNKRDYYTDESCRKKHERYLAKK